MDQHGISKLDLKRQNRMQVLNAIKNEGPTSRIDIASRLELTRAAVTIITNEMIEQGILVETGEFKHKTEKAPRGRKKILLDINHNYKFALGVICEPNNISVGVSTLNGSVLDKRNLTINNHVIDRDIYTFIYQSIDDIMSSNCLTESDILGLGVGIHPNMRNIMGVISVNGVPCYKNVYKNFNTYTNIPVIVDNSVVISAMAISDFNKNISDSFRNIVYVDVSSEFNSVVLYDGNPLEKLVNKTDLINNIIINPNGHILEGAVTGSVKSELSAEGIVSKIREGYSKANTPELYELTAGKIEDVNIANVVSSLGQNTEFLTEMNSKMYTLMNMLIAILANAYSPDKIVFENMIMTNSSKKKLYNVVKELSGEEIADLIHINDNDTRCRFLGGCALVTRELFFKKGGVTKAQEVELAKAVV